MGGARARPCMGCARASLSTYPLKPPTVTEAPARARAPDPPVATAHTPLETPLESPVGTRRPREAAGRDRLQGPPRAPGQKSETSCVIPEPRPSPRRALVGSRAMCGREHICCKTHTNSRPPNHLGANEARVAGRPTKVGPRIYEGGGERETGPHKGQRLGTHPLKVRRCSVIEAAKAVPAPSASVVRQLMAHDGAGESLNVPYCQGHFMAVPCATRRLS